jgi:hypothetical protein
MKIISCKKGFNTNSSSSNFWLVLEKNGDARERVSGQLSGVSSLNDGEISQSVGFFLKDSRELSGKNGNFWHRYMSFRRDTHDKVPTFGMLKLPPFGLDYYKISGLQQDEFDSIITGLGKIEWADWLYKTREISDRTTGLFLKTIQPVSRNKTDDWCMSSAYDELLDCAGKLDDAELDKLVLKLLLVYTTGIFDIERAALVNVFYTFLERAAASRNFTLDLTKARKPDANYVLKLKKSYMESTGKDLEQTIMNGGPGIWDKFLVSHDTSGFKYFPLMDVVKSTDDFIIYPAGDFCPGLRAVVASSDHFGLRDDFESLIAKSAAGKNTDGRLASALLLQGEKYMNEKIV